MKDKKKFRFKKAVLEDEPFIETLKFLEKILEDCRFYLGTSFKEITDVTLENLGDFLVLILKAFSEGIISASKIGVVAGALETYIHKRYMTDYPETSYPDFGEEHPLSVPLTVLYCMDGGHTGFMIFPEDAAFFIEMLQAPSEKALETNYKMYDFVEQFDVNERFQEGKKRGLFDKW